MTRGFRFTLFMCVSAGLLAGSMISRAQSSAPQPASPSQAAVPSQVPAAATAARPRVEQQDAFYVMGLSVRTSNANEGKEGGEIPAMWQKFIQGDVASTIPDKVGDDLYVVYSDYAGQGSSYTYLLGAKVSSIAHLPAGMVAKQVVAGRYAIVPSEKGALPQVVPAVWQKIWTLTPDQLGGKRALKTDFEIYNVQGMDPMNSQVDVHIGLE